MMKQAMEGIAAVLAQVFDMRKDSNDIKFISSLLDYFLIDWFKIERIIVYILHVDHTDSGYLTYSFGVGEKTGKDDVSWAPLTHNELVQLRKNDFFACPRPGTEPDLYIIVRENWVFAFDNPNDAQVFSENEIYALVQVCKVICDALEHKGVLNMYKEQALQAKFDDLTGLVNRLGLRSQVPSFRLLYGKGIPIFVGMIDIDHFKQVNDTMGHPFGDRVLREVASVFKRFEGLSQIICRMGGEEFMVVTDQKAIFEMIRQLVENHKIILREEEGDSEINVYSVTVSIGVSFCDSDDTELNDADWFNQIVKEADDLLYEAKEFGRNRVVYKEKK